MLQVWLVLLGAGLLWQADNWAKTTRSHPGAAPIVFALAALGYIFWLLSVALFFYNGGTTG